MTFKAGLVGRMRSDVVDLVKETKESRHQKGKLTEDEKMTFADQLYDKWEASLNAQVKSWTKETFAQWVEKAKNTWIGFEDQVKDNLLKLKGFFERHSPLRKKT